MLYLHADHLGSTSLTTDASGNVAARQLYHPFGTVRYGEGTLPTDFGFTGQKHDPTGLIFMHARYYDPALGRFVSADTMVPSPANSQDWNRYAYTRNNPVRYTDPSGHCIELDDGFCVRLTNKWHRLSGETGIRVVQGGQLFANPIEVAIANYYLSGGDTKHTDAAFGRFGDGSGLALKRSVEQVVSELGGDPMSSVLPQAFMFAVATAGMEDLYTGYTSRALTPSSSGVQAPLGIPSSDYIQEPFSNGRVVRGYRVVSYRGVKVYQRLDIDWDYVDPDTNLTNYERAQAERPPIGPDGNPIVLHHIGQHPDGPLAEVTMTLHRDYYAALHWNTGQADSLINRSQFGGFREDY